MEEGRDGVYKYVDVSTLHFSKEQIERLGSGDELPFVVISSYRDGFFIAVPDEVNIHSLLDSGFGVNMYVVFTLARNIGATLVRVDTDGHIFNGLVKFNFDEDDYEQI